MLDIGGLIATVFQVITMLIVVWCLLSWFPNIKWYDQPFKTLDQVVQPIVSPFRKLIPPISGIDLSPMVAILVLQACAGILRQLLP